MTVVTCFHLCSCGCELNTQVDLHSIVIVVVVVVVVVIAVAAVVIVVSGDGCDADSDAFHENCIQLPPIMSIPCIRVVNGHAVFCGFSSTDKLYVVGDSRWEDEEVEEHDLEPLPSFAEVHVSFETIKSLFLCLQH